MSNDEILEKFGFDPKEQHNYYGMPIVSFRLYSYKELAVIVNRLQCSFTKDFNKTRGYVLWESNILGMCELYIENGKPSPLPDFDALNEFIKK